MNFGRGALCARLGAALTLVLLAATGQGKAAADSMVLGHQTSQPIGHYEFCKANPTECSIRPSDIDNYGLDEVWTYPDNGKGDCEDYALQKRRLLNEQGISLANLLLTVVRKPDGEGHAVLTVRSDKGDFILDNLSDKVRPWRETGYKYLKRQASYNTGRWVSLLEDNNMLVGSLK